MAFCISVIVNAYINDLFLPQAIESVLDQNYEGDFEILLLTPKSGFELNQRILAKASTRGVRIETVSVPFGPVGLGLDRGVYAAKGDVIALLDDDDLWEREKLESIDRAFRDTRVVYFHNSQTFVDDQDRPLSPFNIHRLIRHPASRLARGRNVIVDASDPSTFARGRAYEPDFNNSSITIQKELLRTHLESARQVTQGEDTFLYYCALSSRGRLVLSTDRLTRYRIHQRGKTAAGTASKDSSGRLEKYLENAGGQQHRLQLVRDEILKFAIPEVKGSLDSDQAFWTTMCSIATGSSTSREAASRTRVLLGDKYTRPRTRELIAVGLGWLGVFMPTVVQAGFSTWRSIW